MKSLPRLNGESKLGQKGAIAEGRVGMCVGLLGKGQRALFLDDGQD